MGFKNIINKIISYSGYQFARVNKNNRSSLFGILNNISKHYKPDFVIDVGAAFGLWSKECHRIFNNSNYILIEPLIEYNPSLEKIKNKIKKSEIINVVASSEIKTIEFNIHKDLVGSSIKNEAEGEEVDGRKRTMPSLTLDEIEKNKNLSGQYLLKIDVQGAELEVLKGAKNLLKNTECVILEVSLFKSFIDGATLYDIILFMKEKGFVAYDIFGFLYRPYDNALSQVDMVFVKENSSFRNFHGYANKKQRERQNKKFQKEISNLINNKL